MVELSHRDATRREHPPLQDYGEYYFIYERASNEIVRERSIERSFATARYVDLRRTGRPSKSRLRQPVTSRHEVVESGGSNEARKKANKCRSDDAPL